MADDHDTASDPPVTVHQTAPDRTVFVEDDNADGWIASDQTVPVQR